MTGDPDLAGLRADVAPVLDALCDVTGFHLAALLLLRGEGGEVVAAGGPAARHHDPVGHLASRDAAERLLERGRGVDGLCFVPAETVDVRGDEVWLARNAGDGGDSGDARDADSWRPADLLLLPVRAGERLVAVVSLDLPGDGLRPDARDRDGWEGAVREAAIGVEISLDRYRLRQRAALARDAGRLARMAAAEVDPQRLVDVAATRLREMVDAQDVLVVLHEVPEIASAEPDPTLAHLAERVAREAWATGRVGVVGPHSSPEGLISDAELALVRGAMGLVGRATVLLVPLGAGPDCLGRITLVRGPVGPDWSSDEIATVRQLGEELGRAVLVARAYRQEHELVEYRSRLVTAVGRELRPPVAAMLEHLAGLQDAVSAAPEDDVLALQLASATGRISRAVQRLSGIVTDLISLGLVEDDPALPSTLVDVGAAAHAAVDLMSIRALRSGVEVVERAEPQRWTRGDAGELERAMINLVGNAVKYTPPGGRVEVSVRRDDAGAVVVEVRDTGIGLSEADRSRLFEEFFRSDDPAARAQEGTGLGLAIVRRIVERHGGRIEVESTLGVGSTFRVLLPGAEPA